MDLSKGPVGSGGGATDPSPSLLNSPEPPAAAAAMVPSKRRRNSAATSSSSSKRAATATTTLGHIRVHKRHGHAHSHGGGLSRAGSLGPGDLALPTTGTINDGNGISRENPVPLQGAPRLASVDLEPITETMSTPERLAAIERNEAAEAAYNDDRRRNNQSAKRSRLKKEMYMVEMDMAIKSYRRNVLQFSAAYDVLKGVLLNHGLFNAAELGEGFVEPKVWQRPVFMPEQEADIADHRAKLEKAAQQVDLPKLGLDFAEKVCELVNREVPMGDRESAVKALEEHHQKIEDCERKGFQLLLQFHEFERKLAETRAKMGEQERRKGELDAALEKYKHLGGPETGQGLAGLGMGMGMGFGKVPVGRENLDLGHLEQRQKDGDAFLPPESKMPTTGLAVRLGQHPQQPGQAQEGETKNALVPGKDDNNREKEHENGPSGGYNEPPLQGARNEAAPEPATDVPPEETDEQKAFLAEIDEYVEAHGGGDLDMGMIKPDDLFDDSALFSGLPGGASFEAMCMSDDSLFGLGFMGEGQQQFFEESQNQGQGFVFGNTHMPQQQQGRDQQLSSPATGSVSIGSAHTVVGVGHGTPANGGVNPFSSPVFGTAAHAHVMPTNWPVAGTGTGLLVQHDTPASPPIGQGIFLGSGSSNPAAPHGMNSHGHGHGHGQWQPHPQFQSLNQNLHHHHHHHHNQQQQVDGNQEVWRSPVMSQSGNNDVQHGFNGDVLADHQEGGGAQHDGIFDNLGT